MRNVLIGLLFLCACSPLRAGVYNFGEKPVGGSYTQVVNALFELRAVPVKPREGKIDPASRRGQALAQVESLERLRQVGLLSTVDAVNLSGAYIRLGEVNEALKVLRKADKGHFLVQANLAAAYQTLGELAMARRCQERALALWPTVWIGFNKAQLDMYRECEKYNLRLLTGRLDRGREGAVRELALDSLFPGVSFVGEDGQYHAGELARRMADKLPREALPVVTQMVLWQPRDPALTWLLAELLNVEGQIIEAARLFDDLVFNQGLDGPGLREHRRVLKNGASVMKRLQPWTGSTPLLSGMMLIPRGLLAPPVVGDIAYQAGALTIVVHAPAMDQPPMPPAPPTPDTQVPPGQQLPFNLRHAAVSFLFGLLVAALLGLQVQQWRRRRRPEPPPTQPTTGETHVLDREGAGDGTAWEPHPDRPEGVRRLP